MYYWFVELNCPGTFYVSTSRERLEGRRTLAEEQGYDPSEIVASEALPQEEDEIEGVWDHRVL